MAGIYIHIPFCRSRCLYCDFYSQTSLVLRQRYVDAVCREMAMRPLPQGGEVSTVYLGGGTPSQLSAEQLGQILYNIYKVYAPPAKQCEVTIEVNPDDVTPAFADALALLPVNRVSMGVQSFSDRRLRFLRRRHTAAGARQAVGQLRRAGIDNLSIDLIYGFPGQTLGEWQADVEAALALGVEHLSAYALQYEEGTPLYAMLQQGLVSEVDEELSRAMYYEMADRLAAAGYEHYEISNFARRGFRSRHNSSYWNHTPYIGLGAAAHSFDGRHRQWNVADIVRYMEGIEKGEPLTESETLTPDEYYNETVMTALRTRDGLPLPSLNARHRTYCLDKAQRFLDTGLLALEDDRLRLTREGLFVSDMVIVHLML